MVLEEEDSWGIGLTTRVFAGVSLGRESRRLKLALLRCRGKAWQLRVQNMDGLTLAPPSSPVRADEILAGLQQLTAQAKIPISSIDSLGLIDLEGDSLPLAEALAEATGITTLCRFTDRLDRREIPRARAIGDWFLYRSQRTARSIIELGSVLRLTILPMNSLPSDLDSFDVGPGNHFLNQFVQRLSQGKYSFDPSGHFAVQGQQDEEILSHWASHPFLLQAPPRTLDDDAFGESFVESSLALARERRRAAKDLLCTACHFVARCLKDVLTRFAPDADPADEVFLVGGGMRNGLVRKLIEETLAPRQVRLSIDVGVPEEIRPAAHAALFAYMAMENLPVGTRMLGAIVPGSMPHWDRWVCNLADRFDADARRAA
jgi:anhydro-N-acetylmuramic acid kinase